MDILLLIISESNLRQLYHELLLTKHIEVIPASTIENAIALLTIYTPMGIVLFADNDNMSKIISFLTIRQKINSWRNQKLIFISWDKSPYISLLNSTDIILDPHSLNPQQIVDGIKKVIDI